MKKTAASGLIVIAFAAFISLGLPDGLLGVAWPGIRDHFALPVDAIGLLLIFGTFGYVTSSFFSGVLTARMGIGSLLGASCLATGTALLVYTVTPYWELFAATAALGGLGAGAIDAGLNGYVARHHSVRTMQWLHASFGIGITSGPIIMTLGITLTSRWQIGYYLVGTAQVLLALVFFTTRGRWTDRGKLLAEAEDDAGPAKDSGTAGAGGSAADRPTGNREGEATILQTLANIPSLLSMLMFFIYTGIEVGLGLWSYTLLTQSRGIDPGIAGFVTGGYWAMFTAGRILAGWYTKHIPVTRLLAIAVTSAGCGVLLVILDLSDWITVAGFAAAGFSVAPIFPGLVSDTEKRVGRRFQAHTIGMQIASAGLGAAAIPSAAGLLARNYGLEIIPLCLAAAIALLGLLFLTAHLRRHPPGASG